MVVGSQGRVQWKMKVSPSRNGWYAPGCGRIPKPEDTPRGREGRWDRLGSHSGYHPHVAMTHNGSSWRMVRSKIPGNADWAVRWTGSNSMATQRWAGEHVSFQMVHWPRSMASSATHGRPKCLTEANLLFVSELGSRCLADDVGPRAGGLHRALSATATVSRLQAPIQGLSHQRKTRQTDDS